MKKSIIILGIAALIASSCGGQRTISQVNTNQIKSENTENNNLPENALCLLSESEYDLTYLTGVYLMPEEKWQDKLIGNGDYFLLYHTDSKSKDTNDKIGGYRSCILHVIPESDGRYKMEAQTIDSGLYIDVETKKIEPGYDIILTYEWNFAGYSDDTNSEEAKVWKYYNETIKQ